jgi:hypothetical protein
MISKNFNFLKVLINSKKKELKINHYQNCKNFAFTPLKVTNEPTEFNKRANNENSSQFQSPAPNKSTYVKPDYFEKFSNVRPESVIKIFSLPRHVQDLYMKAPLDINSELTNKISRKISHDVNSNFVIGNGNMIRVLQTVLLFAYVKKTVYVFIDSEEELQAYLNAAETVLNEPAFHIFDEKSISTIQGYEMRSISFININRLKENNLLDKINNHILDKTGLFIFLDIKNWQNVDDFLRISKVGEKIFKGVISVLQKENEKKYTVLRKYMSRTIQETIFTKKEQKELNLFGISHYGMSVTEEGIITVSLECAKKYLRHGKQVLILCQNLKDKEKILKEIDSTSSIFGKKEKELLKVYLSEEMDQLINSQNQEENSENNNNKAENPNFLNYFDVLIEAPFISETHINYRKFNFLKADPDDNATMISLIRPYDFRIIDEMRQSDTLKIKVINLLSSAFLYNDLITKNDVKTENLNKNEFYEKVENFANEFKPKHKSFDYYYDNIKNNPVLLKKIVHMFFEQNFKEFFTKEREDVSLITGEAGYKTVIIKPMTTLQLEERYSVTRFLLRHGFCETANYDEQVLRIFNSFNFVFDVPADKIDIIRKKAAEENYIIENVHERPIIFYHQFREFLRDNHKEN